MISNTSLVHVQGIFLGFRFFPLDTDNFTALKGSKDLALEGGDEGDSLCV